MPSTPKSAVTSTIKNSAAAPVIYFDAAPVYGAANGVVEIELAYRVLNPKSDGTVGVELTSAGHLRCSTQAAMNLKGALEQALGLSEKPGIKLAS